MPNTLAGQTPRMTNGDDLGSKFRRLNTSVSFESVTEINTYCIYALSTGRVKMQLIKTVFKNIHTLHFKIFKVFKYKDIKCWF